MGVVETDQTCRIRPFDLEFQSIGRFKAMNATIEPKQEFLDVFV